MAAPIRAHDRTKQYHGFAFLQDILDQNSSVTAMLGTSNAIFQIPNQLGLQPAGPGRHRRTGAAGSRQRRLCAECQWPDGFPVAKIWTSASARSPITASSAICIRQGSLDFQVSVFGRYSSLFFTPGDNVGDLLYNGIAQTAYKRDVAYGLQAEGAWHAGDGHTIRFGLLYQADDTLSRTSSLVLPTAPGGAGSPNPNPLCTDPAQTCQTSATPLTIADNGSKHGWNYGFYAQDEWKLTDQL